MVALQSSGQNLSTGPETVIFFSVSDPGLYVQIQIRLFFRDRIRIGAKNPVPIQKIRIHEKNAQKR